MKHHSIESLTEDAVRTWNARMENVIVWEEITPNVQEFIKGLVFTLAKVCALNDLDKKIGQALEKIINMEDRLKGGGLNIEELLETFKREHGV